MNANQLVEFYNLAMVGAYVFAQQMNGQIIDECFAASLAAFHLYCEIGAATNQMLPPPAYEEVPEPDDGYEFDEEVAEEVDLNVDFSGEVDMVRYLDPAEEEELDIDIEKTTPVQMSTMSTAIEFYDKYEMYLSPEVPTIGWWEWQATPVLVAAPAQPVEPQPAPGVPVLEIEEVKQAFHQDFAYPEGPVEFLPMMDIEDVPVENQAGKIKRPRRYRTRHNPLEKRAGSGRPARRQLHF